MYEYWVSLCAIKGKSIAALCEEVTGSRGNLSTWKKGYMRSDYLAKFADALGVSTDCLLKRGKEESPDANIPQVKSSDDAEILHMIQQLSLIDKAEIIVLLKNKLNL